jgi:hypothetical protein
LLHQAKNKIISLWYLFLCISREPGTALFQGATMKNTYLWAGSIFILLVLNMFVFMHTQTLMRESNQRAYEQGQYDLLVAKTYTNKEIWDSWSDARQRQLELWHEERQVEAQKSLLRWLEGGQR